ncbi:hypothetical protein CNEO2_570030 [Clostridium neonatale]|nr:hypothetical protein CNEO2_470028 [Clostridium neonatale]CAI3245220.1 hypothetical protein CNEO2_490031 [Clostridium neonatale]CAI3535478.1 hypothetical protein CNEO3_110020 [Clostridium neonatale]CAI3588865.1 hypothetical protein CNEO2_160002 [Clostridium neonatale]CAI3681836.1 hypothetical protein CNEO2_570030 [Clostridium neonatale]
MLWKYIFNLYNNYEYYEYILRITKFTIIYVDKFIIYML